MVEAGPPVGRWRALEEHVLGAVTALADGTREDVVRLPVLQRLALDSQEIGLRRHGREPPRVLLLGHLLSSLPTPRMAQGRGGAQWYHPAWPQKIPGAYSFLGYNGALARPVLMRYPCRRGTRSSGGSGAITPSLPLGPLYRGNRDDLGRRSDPLEGRSAAPQIGSPSSRAGADHAGCEMDVPPCHHPRSLPS